MPGTIFHPAQPLFFRRCHLAQRPTACLTDRVCLWLTAEQKGKNKSESKTLSPVVNSRSESQWSVTLTRARILTHVSDVTTLRAKNSQYSKPLLQHVALTPLPSKEIAIYWKKNCQPVLEARCRARRITTSREKSGSQVTARA